MIKKMRRLMAGILIGAFVLTSAVPNTVLASDTVKEETTESQETQVMAESTESALEYLYVESPYLETPTEQNIVVSWKNETGVVEKMEVLYQYHGQEGSFELENKGEGLYLYQKEFNETESGVYELTDIRVTEAGQQYTYNLAEVGINACFGVNEYYPGYELTASEEISGTEENVAVISEEDVASAQAEEIVEETLQIAAAEAGVSADISAYALDGEERKDGEDVVVALDAGHCDKHAGAQGNGVSEEVATLKIAQYCKAELEQYGGVKVYMCRTSAACPYPNVNAIEDIKERVRASVAQKADIYVSIHLNSSPASSAYGAEVWYPDGSQTPNTVGPGRELAQKIQAELVSIGLGNRGAKETDDNFACMAEGGKYGLPAIIVEHAFLSNANDANTYLKTEAGLKSLGVADATGIVKYFGLSTGEWVKDSKGWRYKVGNKYLASMWKYINGLWYYFDADTYMHTGWLYQGGATYYMDAWGAMQIGWRYIDEVWYYMNGSGVMQTGWQYLGSSWYYLNASGAMQTGWLKLGSSKFYFESNGAMVTGWKTIEGKKYYFNVNGYMLTGWQYIEGKKYYFDEITGELLEKGEWRYKDNKWYYYDAQGRMTIGWQMIDGTWYYMDASGVMQTGWQYLGGSWYYMNGSGVMQTGWLASGARKCYLQENGAAAIGWTTIKGKKYYFDSNGYMLVGNQTIDGKEYYFDETTGELVETSRVGWIYENNKWYYYDAQGKMTIGWQYISGSWYYMDASGVMQTDWEYINGSWYYMNGSGVMQTGWQYIRGYWYYMNSSGVMQTGRQVIDGKEYYFDETGAMVENPGTEGTYLIEGRTSVTKEQLIKYFKNSGCRYPTEIFSVGGAADIETFCQMYLEEAEDEGIAAEVAFVQAMHETGWLQYGGSVKAEQFNFAGLGAVDAATGGADFSIYGDQGVRMGIRAQIQHLKAYASATITEATLSHPCVDPRFKYVSKGCAKYVEWLGINENPEHKGWAAAPLYGVNIVKKINQLKKL